jgi:hypothetical protein
MSRSNVQQALNDMEARVVEALSHATERLGDLDRSNDGLNAVIVPAWVLRTLMDKIIYDQHFMSLTIEAGDDE